MANNFFNITNVCDRLLFVTIVLFTVLSAVFFFFFPPVSKLALILIIFPIYILNLSISKSNNTHRPAVLILLSLWLYLLINTYLISEIVYESKLELINFGIYFLVFLTFSSIALNTFKIALVISLFCVSAFAFINYTFADKAAIVFYFYNPNILASYSLMVALFSISFLLSGIAERYVKYLCKANIFFSVGIILLTNSLSAFLVALLGFGALFYNKFRLKLRKGVIFFFTVSFLFTAILFANPDSTIDRIAWFFLGIRIWLNNFIFGTGLGTFQFYYSEYAATMIQSSSATLFVHNYFVHLISEIGLIGITLLFLFLYEVFRHLKSSSKGFLSAQLQSNIFFLPVTGVILQSLFDYSLLIPQNSILFFILLAGLYNFGKTQKNVAANQVKKTVQAASESEQSKRIISHTDMNNKRILFILFISVYSFILFLSLKISETDILLKKPSETNLIKVLGIDKSCWVAWKKLGEIRMEQGNFKDAVSFFENSLKYNPRDVESHIRIAALSDKSGDFQKSSEHFIEAVRINPRFALKRK